MNDTPDADVMVEYGGRWLTWAQFLAARLDALMPRQPKRAYAYRASAPK